MKFKLQKDANYIDKLRIDMESLRDAMSPNEKPKKLRLVRWIEENLLIQPKEGGLIRFRLNRFQKRFVALVVQLIYLGIPIRIIELKSRKLGFSTLVEAILFALCHHYPERQGLIVSHRKDSTEAVFRMTQRFIKGLEDAERKPLEGGKPMKGVIQYKEPHSSRIEIMTAGGGEIARGLTPQYNHYSELAFWPDDEITWTAAETAVPKGVADTLLIVESTANGPQGVFFTLWGKAKKFDTPFQRYKYLKEMGSRAGWIADFSSWVNDPEAEIEPPIGWEPQEETLKFSEQYGPFTPRQMCWVEHVVDQDFLGNWEKFHQEYPANPELAFLFSGYPLFDQVKLKALLAQPEPKPLFRGDVFFDDTLIRPYPQFIEQDQGKLWVYRNPDPDWSYFVGVDVSEAIGADYSEIMVIGQDPEGKAYLCAYYYANSEEHAHPHVIAVKAYLLGQHYYWAVVGVERNAVGIAVIGILNEGHPYHQQMTQYPNLFSQPSMDRTTREVRDLIGFQTNVNSKQAAVQFLRETIHRDQIEIPNHRILQQLRGFTLDPRRSGRNKWSQGYKDPHSQLFADDAVMCLAISEFIRRRSFDSQEKTVWAAW